MCNDKVNSVVAALDAFAPSANEPENIVRLYNIFDNFRVLEGREHAMGSMFAVLERYPSAGLGNPGPIVHEIEGIGGHEELLKASLSRLPTATTVWMVNRIMNATTDGELWSAWMQELQSALSHPLADEAARESARLFIEHQNERIET